MRAVLPAPLSAADPESGEPVDVFAHYARDWADPGGFRANMITSIDGAAATDGLSAGLQTAGDNLIFAALRELADVVLVGSSTVQAEGYRPVHFDDGALTRRSERGFGDRLPIAVVTRSLRLDLSAPLFDDPQRRPLVVTCASSGAERRAALAERADVLVCGDDDIDYVAVRHEFAERGLRRVLCEGGPTILGQLALAGALDELCLSLSPLLAGPGTGRIVNGGSWPGPRAMRLTGLLEDDGALFLRYAR